MADPKAETKASDSPEPMVKQAKELQVEVVRHGGTYLDVRVNKDIRRVQDKELAAKHKLGDKLRLSESLLQDSDFAPYAKPRK